MKRTIIIAVVILVLAGGVVAFSAISNQQQADGSGEYQTEVAQRGELEAFIGATGTVRANQTANLLWETSGQVEEVFVALGDTVEAGQTLAALAQTSLPQNVILAQADLVGSQQALEDLLQNQTPAAQAFQAVEAAQEAFDDLEINYGMRQALAQQALFAAQDAMADAEYRWQVQQPGYRASGDTVNGAEANLVLAEQEVDRAQTAYNKVSGRDGDDPSKALALSNLVAAKQQRDSVLRQLNWYTGSPTDIDQGLLDSDVAIAQANLAEAETEWERVKDGPSEAEVKVLEAQLADALLALEQVKDGVNAEDIAAAEARVAAAQATLNQMVIAAPFAGSVTGVQVLPGDQISPNNLAIRLDDLSRLLLDVEISEVDINQVQVGQPVLLTFDAILGAEYQGEVIEVAPVGTEQQGVVNFSVTVALVDPDDDVKPGMRAAVNILVSQLEDVLLVPNRAVRSVDGMRLAYILDNSGNLVPVEITLGATSDSYSEVVAGDLQIGDRIVLNPPAEVGFSPGPGGSGSGGIFGGGGS